MDTVSNFIIYTDLLWRSIDVTILILVILLLRKAFQNHLSPWCARFLWSFVALRIFIPLQIPLMKGLPSTLNLSSLYHNIELWVSDKCRMAWKQWLEYSLQGLDNTSIAKASERTYRFYDFWDNLFIDYSLSTVLALIWLIGAFVVTIIFIVQNIHFHKHMKKHGRIYGLKNKLPVYIIDDQGGSCLSGIANPEIYVSHKALDNLNWCKWIVAHELGHYQARDNWYSLLRSMCIIAMWFHPLIWYAAKVSQEDCEFSCDDRVLKHADRDDCIEYGECLIAMAAGYTSTNLRQMTQASHLNKNAIKKRITRIANRTAITHAKVVNSLCILLVISCYLITVISM